MKNLFYFLFIPLTSCLLLGQSPQISAEDYRRAEEFLKIRDKVENIQVNPIWYEDGLGFHFESKNGDRKEYKKVNFPDMEPALAFDHKRLATVLNEEFDLELDDQNLALFNLKFANKDELSFLTSGQNYTANLQNYTVKKDTVESSGPFESTSPDGKWIAFTKEYNLFIRDAKTGEEIQLSTEGHKNYEYGSYYGWGDVMIGEDGGRPKRLSVRWSPDSKKILSSICDLRKAEKMYMLDWSMDHLYRPRLLSYYRGSPGDETVVKNKPVLFDIDKKEEIQVDMAPRPHFASASFSWRPDSKYLIGRAYKRGYKEIQFYYVNAGTGEVKSVYHEKSPTSVNNAFYEFYPLENSEQLIFTSEKTGWNHFYILDLTTSSVNPLTKGDFPVNNLIYVDEQRKYLYFTATGVEKDRNVYLQHLYRVKFGGGIMEKLTSGNVHHDIRFSPDGQYFVDNASTIYEPTTSLLIKTSDLNKKSTLQKTDPSDLEATGWTAPQTEIIKAADGVSDIYVAIWKPSNFDPSKSYPLIDYSYTGPFTFRFPRTFSHALSPTNQSLAELGFIVVTIDGRGSAGRSKAFRDVSYKRLGYGLVDHVYAIKELGKKYNWIDADRVGIFGHSAGGYDAARGMLLFPDFYKVAVSSSADHDHRMEKAWWPEMYMGWPVDTAYHNQSNITNAAKLKGKLLLVHGAIDENVNASATFKLSEALVKADKDFDLLIFPSQRHGYRGLHGKYFTKKRWNYFVEHLLGAEPIWDY